MSVGHESGPWVDFISFYFFQLPSLRIVHIDTADTVVDIDIGIDVHMVRASNPGLQPFPKGSALPSYSPVLLWLSFRNISLISGLETSIGLLPHVKRRNPCRLPGICFESSSLSTSLTSLCPSRTEACGPLQHS